MTLTFMATGQDALHVEIGGLLRISIVSSARWFVFQPFHSDTVLIAFNVLSKKKKMLDHVFNTGVVPASTDASTVGPELDDEWDTLMSTPSMRSSVTAVLAATHPGLDARSKT